jgi:hypothetical protein
MASPTRQEQLPEHDPEKWEPVFGKIMLNKKLDHDPIQSNRIMVQRSNYCFAPLIVSARLKLASNSSTIFPAPSHS